jgi:hypothetical protein
MVRYFKNWKFIFVITLILLCGAFYIFMVIDALRPPAKAWSREVLISEINNSRTTTAIRVTSLPIEKQKKFIVLWNEKDCVKYTLIDNKGKSGTIKKINITMNAPKVLKGVLKEDELLLYTIEGKEFKKYSINYATGKCNYVKLLEGGVESFSIVDKNIFLIGDKFVKFVDENGNKELVNGVGGEIISAVKNESGGYRIVFIQMDKLGTFYVKYTEFYPHKKPGNIYNVGYQTTTSNELSDIDNIIIGSMDNKVYIMLSRKLQTPGESCSRPPKDTNTRTLLYSFDEKHIEQVKTDYLGDINGYEPNPTLMYNDKTKIAFLASVLSIKGNDTQMFNIREFYLRKGVLHDGEFLTKTLYLSKNPNWFILSGENYLEWEDSTGASTKILFASTDKDVVKSAGALSFKEAFEIFLNSVMPLGFSLSFLLLISTLIILPTLLFIIIIAALFMNWAETNQRKASQIAIGIHIIAELVCSYYFAIKKPTIIQLSPPYLQNSLIRYGLIILLGVIAYYCMLLKYKDDKLDKSFINQYAFFGIINVLFYALLIFPYYYI